MDIIDFINSRDIRKYLHEINYLPATDEAAFMVYWSVRGQEEKIEAYEWIISNMPDMYGIDCSHFRCDDFHDTLRKFIRLQKDKIRASCENDGPFIYTDESLELDRIFEWMFFHIPTPFKRGDIVINNYIPSRMEEPFVLTHMASWDVTKMYEEEAAVDFTYWHKDKEGWEKWWSDWYRNAPVMNDTTDMNAYGVGVDDASGTNDSYVEPNFYLNLEYYDNGVK